MSLGPESSVTDDKSAPTADAAEVRGPAEKAIAGRSLKQIAWRGLKTDKVALGGACVVIFRIVVAILAPVLSKLFGHPIDEYHIDQIDATFGTPIKPYG